MPARSMDHGKAQSAVEMLTTYAWAFIIISVFLSVMFLSSVSKRSTTYASSSCYISPTMPCSEVVFMSNSLGSQVTVIFNNNLNARMSFSGNAMRLTPTLPSQRNYTGQCLPLNASPGALVICNVTAPGLRISTGTQVSSVFTITYRICGSACDPSEYNTTGTSVAIVDPWSRLLSTVTLSTNPTTGNIVFGGVRYPNNATVPLLYGLTYTVYALPPSGYAFSAWSASGNVVVNQASSQSSYVVSTGAGTITASFATTITTISSTTSSTTIVTSTSTSTTSTIYAPPLTPLLYSTPSLPLSIDSGQSVTFNAVVTGGNPPYTYNFIISNTVTGAIFESMLSSLDSLVFTPSTSAVMTLHANVTVTDLYPTTVNSVYTDVLTVNPALSIPQLSSAPSLPSTQAMGNTVLFTASWSGGTPPYTANFMLVNLITKTPIMSQVYAGITGTSNAFTFDILPAYVGNTVIANVTITDSASPYVSANSAESDALTVVTGYTVLFSAAGSTGNSTISAPDGYAQYLCNGANYYSDATPLWNIDAGTTQAYVGSQSGNVCDSNAIDPGYQSLGVMSLNATAAPTLLLQQTFNSTTSFTSDTFTPANSGAFIVISVACGQEPCSDVNLPATCTKYVDENQGSGAEQFGTSVMAVCQSLPQTPYTVSGDLLGFGYVSVAVYEW